MDAAKADSSGAMGHRLLLSSKVASVLSTSFSDAEFREALALFDQRDSSNDAKTRRQIRLQLNKDVVDCNGLVIDHFSRVVEQLHYVKAILNKLNAECEGMKHQIGLAQDETTTILCEAGSLLKRRECLRNKQNVLATFQNRFLMTEPEIVRLTSTGEPLDDRFFTTLNKAKAIIQDCQVLLGLESQAFGLDLMEQTSKNLNLGFQKLYKWTQREFRTLNLENPQMSASIRLALRVLAERPSLFQSCLDCFSEARERILSEAFHVALTGTTSSGTVDTNIKPIDLAAHDMFRFVGDMLAWVHTTTVSEREALEILFVGEGEELKRGFNIGRDTEAWALIADDADPPSEFDAITALGDLVDKNMSGAARLLRQRVEQVVRTNDEVVPAYRLATLLAFYRTTFERLLGSSSNLLESVQTLEAEALRQFRLLIKDTLASVQGDTHDAPVNLSPPKFFVDALEQLKVIMQTYDSSLSSIQDRESEFEVVMQDAFEPFLLGCENIAKAMTSLRGSIFAINFNVLAEKYLSIHDFTKRRADELRRRVESEARKIVESQYEFFRLGSGLGPALVERMERETTVRTDVSKDILSEASRRLDEFLPSALMDANDRLRFVQDAVIARRITAEAAEMFCQDFEKLECGLRGEGGDGILDQETLSSVFPRTSADIRVLLS